MADESFWIEEKLPLASSDQLGHSTSEVQALQKKHDLLEADIKTHEKVSLISSNEATLQFKESISTPVSVTFYKETGSLVESEVAGCFVFCKY